MKVTLVSLTLTVTRVWSFTGIVTVVGTVVVCVVAAGVAVVAAGVVVGVVVFCGVVVVGVEVVVIGVAVVRAEKMCTVYFLQVLNR